MSWIELNWAELSWIELNWAELSWIELSLAEFCWVELVWAELSWAELSSCPMGDWTSQNWTKRDGRNNQEQQQQQQEKKVTYKTAAELAVKKCLAFIFQQVLISSPKVFLCLWMLLSCSFIMKNHYKSKFEFTRSSFVNILSTMPSNVFRSWDKILVISVNGWLDEYWLRWAQSFKRSTAWKNELKSHLINVFLKIVAKVAYFLYRRKSVLIILLHI